MTPAGRLHAVLTTIRPPTPSVIELHRRLGEPAGRLVIAGDTDGPDSYPLPGVRYLRPAEAPSSDLALARRLPPGHYARKNIGYLEAIRSGAGCLYETDDDNAPLPEWGPRADPVAAVRPVLDPAPPAPRWVNVYRYFTDDPGIWPRGFPLDRLAAEPPPCGEAAGPVRAPVQQGLVNGSPDVDAVWRLTQDRPFRFDNRPPVRLAPGQWCPFNTQSTWWWPEAYPLLYVPRFCPFRLCDLWKSFVAQRCLWALGLGVVFHAPEAFQERNRHDLMKDFRDELPGYLGNDRLAGILEDLALDGRPGSVAGNLRACYGALVSRGILPAEELGLVDAWLADLESVRRGAGS